jgi:hypothetical protein
MANFSSGEAQRPSFFEMVAQQELLPFFGPALKYALSVRPPPHPTLCMRRHVLGCSRRALWRSMLPPPSPLWLWCIAACVCVCWLCAHPVECMRAWEGTCLRPRPTGR